MSLRTTELGFTLIKAFESCKLKAYKCPAGVWTIGYGHTSAAGGLQVDARTTITKKQAEELIREDVDVFEDKVEKLIAGIRLTETQFDALVSLAFNIGVGNLTTSTLLKRVRAGDHDAAAREFMKWDKARVNGVLKRLPGLTRRRNAEAALYRGDLHVAETYVGVDFGEMPQLVEAPVPPKTMAESKTGNASIVGGVTSTGALGFAAFDQVKEVVTPAQEAIESAREVSTQVQQTTDTVGQHLSTVEAVTKSVDMMELATRLAPWLVVLVVLISIFAFIYSERKKILEEDHV